MTLQLVNEYSSHNLGDAVIYETLAQLAAPHAATTGLSAEARAHVRGLLPAGPARQPAAYVSVGGDIFNNARPRLVTRRFAGLVHELAQCPPEQTFLFGQGVPASCRGLAFAWLASVLRRLSSVTVRDALSHARLQARGVRATLSYDLAFAYSAGPGTTAAAHALFDAAGVDPQRAVLMSVRGFDALYPHDERRFVARLAELAKRLRARGHQPAILIQARADGADSDLAVLAQLQAQDPALAVLDPFALTGEHHPIDALLGALAVSRSVVAVRYHTAVLRLLMGRMPYGLHYSTKGADLAQRLALPGQALADFDPADAVRGIEASADLVHDPMPQRRDVADRFASSLAAARAAGLGRRRGAPATA